MRRRAIAFVLGKIVLRKIHCEGRFAAAPSREKSAKNIFYQRCCIFRTFRTFLCSLCVCSENNLLLGVLGVSVVQFSFPGVIVVHGHSVVQFFS